MNSQVKKCLMQLIVLTMLLIVSFSYIQYQAAQIEKSIHDWLRNDLQQVSNLLDQLQMQGLNALNQTMDKINKIFNQNFLLIPFKESLNITQMKSKADDTLEQIIQYLHNQLKRIDAKKISQQAGAQSKTIMRAGIAGVYLFCIVPVSIDVIYYHKHFSDTQKTILLSQEQQNIQPVQSIQRK